METISYSDLFEQVFIAAIAAVGLVEWIKNFVKTNKTWIYSLLMIPISIGCYMSCIYLPKAAIGCILTVGLVQDCYQVLIQSVKGILKNIISKNGGEYNDSES